MLKYSDTGATVCTVVIMVKDRWRRTLLTPMRETVICEYELYK